MKAANGRDSVAHDCLVTDLIVEHVEAHPDAEAICSSDGESLSYRALDNASRRLASHLTTQGVKPEVIVPLCFEKSIWTVVAIVAVLKAGGAFVLLDPAHPTERLETIIRKCQATVAVTSRASQKRIAQLVPRALCLDRHALGQLAPTAPRDPASGVAPGNAAYVVYTSGSTGQPKGAVIEHGSFCAGALGHAAAMGMDAATRAVQFASYNFDASITEMLTTLAVGGTVCVVGEAARLDAAAFAAAVAATRANFALLTASFINALPVDGLPGLRTLVQGGEALPEAVKERWAERVTLMNAYGQVEASVVSTCTPPISRRSNGRSIGTAVAGRCWVVDPDDPDARTPAGEVGELLVEGPHVGRGYLGEPEKTAAVYVGRPLWHARLFPAETDPRALRFYRTGDLVMQEPDGSFTFAGRKDEQVKVNGQRIELGEIEHQFKRAMRPPRDIVVELVKRKAGSGTRGILVAFVALDGDWHGDEAAAQRRLDAEMAAAEKEVRAILPKFMMPAAFVAVQNIPISINGKVDRKSLRALGEARLSRKQQHVGTPGGEDKGLSPVEAHLRQVWSRVLNVPEENIERTSMFQSLGGDSISAMQVVSQAAARGVRISVQRILQKKTIEQIALGLVVESSPPTAEPLDEDDDDTEEPFKLSPIQQLFFQLSPEGENRDNISFLLRLNKKVSRNMVDEALEGVVNRNPMLRARFFELKRGNWFQYISQDTFESYHIAAHAIDDTSDVMPIVRKSQRSLDIKYVMFAFHTAFPERSVPAFFVEGHGREPSWDDSIDLSSTVGWFTTLLPIVLSEAKCKHPIDALREIKSLRAQFMDKGLAQFASKFYQRRKARYPSMEITFNYAGMYQQLERSGGLFSEVPEYTLMNLDGFGARMPRFGLVEILGNVEHGQIKLSFTINRRMRHQERLREWMQQCQSVLATMASQLAQAQPGFPLLGASDAQLTRLVDHVLPGVGVGVEDVEDVYPCSPMQNGMLLSRAGERGSYNSQLFLELRSTDGHIDTSRLERAWQAVIDRHAVLRTLFVESVRGDGSFDQVVLRQAQGAVTHVDDLEREPVAPRAANEPEHRLFVQVVSRSHVLLRLDISHVLIDGSSTSALMRDIQRGYDSPDLLAAEPRPLYSTYIEHVSTLFHEHSVEYWKENLSGAEPCHLLQWSEEQDGTLEFAAVPPINTAKITAFCRQNGITVSDLLKTAWAIVLRCYTGSDAPVFGYLSSGRGAEHDQAVGVFTNILPCLARLSPTSTVSDALKEIQDDGIEQMPHKECPLADVMHAADVADAAREGLFNTAMSMQKVSFPSGDGSLAIRMVREKDPTEFAATFLGYISDAGIELVIEYWTSRISTAQAQNLASTVSKVVQSMTENPQSTIGDLDVLSGRDVDSVRLWNSRLAHNGPINSCIHHLIKQVAKRQPDRPAVHAWDERLTYGQLEDLSSRLAGHLHNLGILPDQIIPVCMEKSAWTVVSMLAVLKAGGAFVPFDTEAPLDRLLQLLKDTSADFVIASPKTAHRLQDHIQQIVVSSAFISRLPERVFEQTVMPNNLAYVLFTSGSTGTPKGIMMQHSQFLASSTRYSAVLGLNERSRILQFSAYTFDASIFEVWSTLTTGGCVCQMSEEQRMNDVTGAIHTLAADTMFMTPTMLSIIEPRDVPSIRTVITGGEVIKQDIFRTWAPAVRLLEAYGPTETAVFATFQDAVTAESDRFSIGQSFCCQAWVVDPGSERPVPVGAAGELWLEGPSLARGYLNNAAQTAAAFVARPDWFDPRASRRFYRTGDLVRYKADGSIQFCGRKDTQVKIRGQRVELSEVEEQAKLVLACSAPIAAEVVQSKLVLLVEMRGAPAEQVAATVEALETLLPNRLPRYMVPSAIVPVMEAFQRMSSGKLDRKWLRAVAAKQANAQRTARQGSGRLWNGKLQRALSRVLGLPESEICGEDNFFHLGGDSFLAMKLVAAARAEDLHLSVAAILRNPVLSDMAKTLESVAPDAKNVHGSRPFELIGDLASSMRAEAVAAFRLQSADEIEDIYPATPLQEAFIVESTKNATAYTAQHVVELPSGPDFDMDRFRAAWETCVQEHPILRTKFFQTVKTKPPRPMQVVLRGVSVEWGRGDDLNTYLHEAAHNPVTPLNKVAIINDRRSGVRLFVWLAHHTLYDGYSLDMLLGRVHSIYARKVQAAPKPVPFQAYVGYLHGVKESRETASFWMTYLAGAPAPSFPPTSAVAAKVDSVLDYNLRLPQRSKAAVTLATTLQTAWALVVAAFSGGAQDVVFGSIVSGRSAPMDGIAAVTGPTIAAIPVRVRFSQVDRVQELLLRVQEQSSTMIPHESLGLQNIQALSQSTSRACAFKNLFVVQPAQAADAPYKVTSEALNVGSSYSYPLTVVCSQLDDRTFNVNVTYASAVLRLSQVEKLMREFQETGSYVAQLVVDLQLDDLERFKAAWESVVATHPILRTRIVHLGAAGMFQTVLRTAKSPVDWRVSSNLDAYVAQDSRAPMGFGDALVRYGIVTGDGDGAKFVWTAHHAVYDGATVAMLSEAVSNAYSGSSPKAPPPFSRLMNYLSSLNPAQSDDFWRSTLAGAKPTPYPLPLSLDYTPHADTILTHSIRLPRKPTTTTTATLLQTAWAYVLARYSGSDDVVLGVAQSGRLAPVPDIARIPGPAVVTAPLRIRFDGRQSVAATLDSVQRWGVESIAHLHRGLQHIRRVADDARLACDFRSLLTMHPQRPDAEMLPFDLATGRLLGAGAADFHTYPLLLECAFADDAVALTASLDASVVDGRQVGWMMAQLEHVLRQLMADDAATKRVAQIELLTPEDCERIRAWSACALETGPAWVVDLRDRARLAPAGVVGELFVEQPGRAEIARPVRLEQIGRRVYATGKLARFGCDGVLDVVGEKDELVELDGRRFVAGDVERLVSQALWNREAAVKAVNGTLTAFVALDHGYVDDEIAQKLLDALVSSAGNKLSRALPSFMVPTHFIPVRSLPRTPSGSIDRQSLSKLASTSSATSQPSGVPERKDSLVASGMEQNLIALWKTVLDLEDVGVGDSFLRLGGDSLDAMKLVAAARREGILLTVKEIFDNPVLSDLAEVARVAEVDTSSHSAVDPFCMLGSQVIEAVEEVAAACQIDKELIEDIYPCAPLQEGLMALSNVEQGAYVAECVVRVPDAEKTEVAWKSLVAMTPVLRTRIVQTDQWGSLQVAVREDAKFQYGQNLNHYLTTERQLHMLPGTHLVRPGLVTEGNSTYFVLFAHHAIFDGWAWKLILQRLYQLYQGHRLLPSPSYSAFVKYLHEDLHLEAAQDFWRSYLEGADRTVFPPMSASTTPRPESHETRRIILQRQNTTTASSLIQTAWALLVSRYVDSQDVTIAVTLSGRSIPVDGIQDMIGPTFTTIPMRFNLDGSKQIADICKSAQDVTVNPAQHLGLQRIKQLSASAHAACDFNSLLVVQPASNDDDDGNFFLQENDSQLISSFSNYGLVMLCQLLPDGNMDASVVFDPSITSQQQTARLLGQFEHILHQLSSGGCSSVGEIDFLSPDDKHEISDVNKDLEPHPDVGSCLHEIVQRLARTSPHAPAVSSWDGNLTYAELDELASRLAGYLTTSMGVVPGAMVPLCFEKSKWTQVAMLGVMKAGAAFVLLDPAHPISRIQSTCRKVNAKVAVVSAGFEDLLSEAVQITVVLNQQAADSLKDPYTPIAVNPTDAAYVVTTSGTSGEPKACVIEHGSIVAGALGFAATANLSSNTRALQFASYSFDASIIETLMVWVAGGCVCVLSETDRKDNLPEAITALQINWALMTPSLASLLKPEAIPTMKTIVIGGEAATSELLSTWTGNVELLQAYGPPLNGVKAWVVNPSDHDKLMPVGSVGELVIEGRTVGKGYINEPEKTAAAFIATPLWRQNFPGYPYRFYKTGDLVRYGASGSLEFIGRKDSQVKLRGQRLELAEIEHHLRRSMAKPCDLAVELITPTDQTAASAMLAAFIAVGDTFGDSKSSAGQKLEEVLGDARSTISTLLPSYMIPRLFVPLRKIPLSVSGKVDRKALRKMESKVNEIYIQPVLAVVGEANAPRTSMEQTLQSLWARVLNTEISRIHTKANFTDLGGDSLTAMRLASRARQAGISLSVADIMRQPRFVDMAAKCQPLTETETIPDVEPFSTFPEDVDQFLHDMLSAQRSDIEDVVEATAAQKAMTEASLSPQQGTINHVWLDFGGLIDASRMKDACSTVVNHHSILRTVFIPHNETLMQVVYRSLQPEFREYHADENIEEMTTALVEASKLRMESYGDYGLRFSFIHYNIDNKPAGRLIMRIPHSLYDGISLPIVLDHLRAAYEKRDLDITPSFSSFLYSWRHLQETGGAEDFWKKQLKGSRMTEIAAPAPRSATNNPNTHLTQRLPLSLFSSSKHTFETLLHASWALVLHSLTGHHDILFGRGVANRSLPLPTVVGPTLNTVPVRVQLSGRARPAAALLSAVEDTRLAALPHELLETDRLVARCTDWPRAARFPSLLVHNNLDAARAFDDGRLPPVGGVACRLGWAAAPWDAADVQITSTPEASGGSMRVDLSEYVGTRYRNFDK
ncbi:putative nonribosomal peptide protein [Neofusicoccum parvum UCRNP2]|uniref:Putative nonribosomal peptide protein n=1 Tax=Botryosphaeria parva (strain UCR-NP2) TaxID=1287680 RepID=R1G5F2_BOTPV|nr:putative nonribosomal peptide protein [Neofusicoccum parvum UCRNP2]